MIAKSLEYLRHLEVVLAVTKHSYIKEQIHLAQETEIANSTISAVLSGKRDLTRRQVAKLSVYFHVDPGVFLVPAVAVS